MARALPPLNAIRAFEAAARRLSFSRAADELHVTPAAISQQVKHLEEWLQIPLFLRRNRNLTLTEAGQELLPDCSDGLDRIAGAISRVRRTAEGGALNVAGTAAFAGKWLIPRLERFRRLHADIEVRIAASNDLVDFNEGDVDLGIRFGRGDYPGLEAEWLLGEEVFPVCSPRLLDGPHPLQTPDDLKHHQLLHDGTQRFYDVTADWAMWLKAVGIEGVDPNYGMTLTPWTMVVQAAIEGQGVALGRGTVLADDLAAGRLVRLFDLSVPSDFAHWLVYRPGALRRRKIKAFRDWITAEAEAARTAAA